MNKNKVILVSTVSVEERTKEGVANVFYTCELLSVTDASHNANELQMQFLVKSVVKNEQGAVPINENGDVLGTYKYNEMGIVDPATVDIADSIEDIMIGETVDFNTIKHLMWKEAFKKYCNENQIYDLSWVSVEV